MKRSLLLFSCAMFFILANAKSRIPAEVYKTGALARICVKVVDQDGKSVSGAKIWGGFTSGNMLNDYVLVEGWTDENGEFVAQGKCNEFLRFDVVKRGYYHSEEKVYFGSSEAVPLVVDGKWQPFGDVRTVILKKIKKPWGVSVFDEKQCRHEIPVFGQWLPFDMECSDWLSPYGKGLHDDVLLRFEKKETGKWYEFSFSMEACFTNHPYAGVYCRPMDEFSDLKTAYEADTNANFNAFYTFSIDSQPRKRVIEKGLARDSYLVFRTRTRVDKQGRLIGAHYGKYCRGWRSDSKQMLFGEGCFNQVENDPNIEGDLIVKYAIKNYKARK